MAIMNTGRAEVKLEAGPHKLKVVHMADRKPLKEGGQPYVNVLVREEGTGIPANLRLFPKSKDDFCKEKIDRFLSAMGYKKGKTLKDYSETYGKTFEGTLEETEYKGRKRIDVVAVL